MPRRDEVGLLIDQNPMPDPLARGNAGQAAVVGRAFE
jgi:hypothetical protein